MAARMLSNSLVNNIRSLENLLCLFNNDVRSCRYGRRRYFRLFLCAATLHNHTELVTLLLSDPRCDLDEAFNGVPDPLFLAIRSGNTRLVEMFLSSPSTTTSVTAELRIHAPYDDELTLKWCRYSVAGCRCYWHQPGGSAQDGHMSAIEYACFWYQPEVFKLLISYHVQWIRNQRYTIIFLIIFLEYQILL